MACLRQCNLTEEYAAKHYGLEGYGCGFCRAGVPRESKIGVEAIVKRGVASTRYHATPADFGIFMNNAS